MSCKLSFFLRRACVGTVNLRAFGAARKRVVPSSANVEHPIQLPTPINREQASNIEVREQPIEDENENEDEEELERFMGRTQGTQRETQRGFPKPATT